MGMSSPFYGNDGSQPASGNELRPQRQHQFFEDCLGLLTVQGQFALSKEERADGDIVQGKARERAASRSQEPSCL